MFPPAVMGYEEEAESGVMIFLVEYDDGDMEV
jgi:hypothetical protein